MCEGLVRARHALTVDAENNKGIWRRGDFVSIERDGYRWGVRERKLNWISAGNDPSTWHKNTFLIKIPGLNKAKLASLLQDHYELVSTFPTPLGLVEDNRMVRQRMRYLAIDAASSAIRTAVGKDFEITVTIAQIKNFFRDKDTGTVLELGI